MTSYKQFTYYEGSLSLEITTNNDTGIYAFIIYNSNVRASELRYPDNIVSDLVLIEEPGLEANTYNLLFRYEPNGTPTTRTYNQKIIFYTDEIINENLVIDWTNNTTNPGDATVQVSNTNPDPETSAFSNTFPNNWNREISAQSENSGSGDPHIRPMFGSRNKTYLLPCDNKIYKYFDNQDTSERIVINAQMWLLSLDLILFAEELLVRRQGRNNLDKYPQAAKNIIDYPVLFEEKSKYDPSFARFISIRYKNEKVILDGETLEIFTSEKADQIKYTEIKESDGRLYRNKKGEIGDTKMRTITIPSKKLGEIRLIIYRDYKRLNHRNHITLMFKNHNGKYLRRCSGVLMNLKSNRIVVPTLDYVDRINHKHNGNHRLITLDKYLKQNKAELRKERFKVRNMIRANDFSLLHPENL